MEDAGYRKAYISSALSHEDNPGCAYFLGVASCVLRTPSIQHGLCGVVSTQSQKLLNEAHGEQSTQITRYWNNRKIKGCNTNNE